MKKNILVLTFLFSLFFFLSASAHEIKRSGTIDVLLHLEPLDNPAVNEQAQLYFSFSDSTNKFKIENCDCSVKISNNGQVLQQTKVTEENFAPDWGNNVARIPFIFPHKGIYQVELVSKSVNKSFKDLTLKYDVRIERESEAEPLTPKDEAPNNFFQNYYMIGGVIIIGGIIVYELLKRKNKKK